MNTSKSGFNICPAPTLIGDRNRLLRLALLIAFVGLVAVPPAAVAQAVQIDGISPAAARRGEAVTIHGIGFGAANVYITVGGIAATVLTAAGSQATFRVPDGAPLGTTIVSAMNPGGRAGTIGLRVLEGVLLPGNPSSPVRAATFDMPPVRVPTAQIEHRIIMTRLDVRFAADATIGQINSALVGVDGGIVSMSQGSPVVTIAIPRPSSVAALQAIARTLSAAAGIDWAFLAREAALQVLPPSSSSIQDEQLLPTRFPAAWNAMQLATQDCAVRKVPVLVADDFIRPAPLSHIGFAAQIPNFLPSPPDESGDDTHGYDVTTTLAALFDDHVPTGANPFSQCLEVTAVQIAGVSGFQAIDRMVRNFPDSGLFILNYSNGFHYDCEPETLPNGEHRCTPDSIRKAIPTAYERAHAAGYWKLRTLDRWDDFIAAASAGNNRDEIGARIYPGLGVARYNSAITTAGDADPLFGFISDSRLWRSTIADPELPDLTATPDEVARLRADLVHDGLDHVGAASNVLVVGSTKPGATFADLRLSDFSGSQADISAVGQNIVTFSPGAAEAGTSFSTPQVAGLASYLWLLSNDLRNEPASVTLDAISENARAVLVTGPVVDAYATILSLDAAATPTPTTAPVRLAILDVNNDGRFNENDVAIFLAHLLDTNGKPVEPAVRDYSRFDLNGDGFTGGSRTESFDLDRIDSTQFGSTNYAADVTQQIEDKPIHYNSNAVTDLDILCYYAYSPMYSGDTAQRAAMLGFCAGVTVTIQPTSVTLAAGGTQQFVATVHGSADPRVNWSATGGTITNTGLFTAGGTPGTFYVRATSVADGSAFSQASVTISGSSEDWGLSLLIGEFHLRLDTIAQVTLSESNVTAVFVFDEGLPQEYNPRGTMTTTSPVRVGADGSQTWSATTTLTLPILTIPVSACEYSFPGELLFISGGVFGQDLLYFNSTEPQAAPLCGSIPVSLSMVFFR